MKKIPLYYIFIVLISFLPLVSILFTDKLFHTHDGYAHLPRIAAYVKALRDGEFPVRWAGDLNYGYGMPVFNFMYPLPYLLSSGFVFVGFTLANALRLTLALSYLLSGIGMFGFALAFFKDRKKALLLCIMYQFTSFRFIEIMVRGDIGEVYAYTFLPFVLWSIVNIFTKQSARNIVLSALAASLLILSHNSLSLLFFGIVLGFIILFSPSKKSFFTSLFALILGLSLSSFYWVPALAEDKFTYGELFMRNRFLEYFPPFKDFFIPNFTNGASLWTKGIAVQFGLMQLLAVGVSIYALFKKKLTRMEIKFIVGSLILFICCLFIMHPISIFVWNKFSLLRQFQFPWRFLGVVLVSTSFLSISFLSLSFFKKKIPFFVLLFFIIITSIGYWIPPLGYEKINENYWWNYPLTTTYFGETDLIWSEGPAKNYPKSRIEVIQGLAKISNFSKKTTMQTFKVLAQVDSTLVSHTQFFPGWRVLVNRQEVPVQFQDQNYRGQITFHVPKGKSNVIIMFGEDKLRMIFDYVSLITILLLIIISFFTYEI